MADTFKQVKAVFSRSPDIRVTQIRHCL